MEHITVKTLQACCDSLNRITNSPMTTYTEKDGKYTVNIGNYSLGGAYGGYALQRNGGGIDVFGGHFPKRELYIRIQAYKQGLLAMKDTMQ